MLNFITIWRLLAGVAFFLWGMQSIEDSLQFLSNRPFKLFLKKLSASRIKSIVGGTLASLVMQSSSLVNMMILAFVATEVIQMENALALMLGSNLGTTFNSWIFVFAGFKLEMENFAFALAGIFGFILYLSTPGKKLHYWSKFLFGIGVILIGLNFIKTGMEITTEHVNLADYNQYHTFLFLLIGIALTGLLQASSATMVIVLSALNAQAIPLLTGMAVILGSEVGTTLKFLLVSLRGNSDKKRVAVANTLFNVLMALLIYLLLVPIDHLIRLTIGIHDPLISIVFFQSLVNVIAILVFAPFLHPISQLLKRWFTRESSGLLQVQQVNVRDTEKAMGALESDVQLFMICALRFTRFSFDLPVEQLSSPLLPKLFQAKNDLEQYEYLKALHGEIHQYGHRLISAGHLNQKQEERLQQLLTTSRNTMYGSKNIKDAFADLHTLRESSNEVKFGFYTHTSQQMGAFVTSLLALLPDGHPDTLFQHIKDLYTALPETYQQTLQQLYKDDLAQQLSVTEISTLLNFNREIYTALKSFLFAIKEYLLTEEEARYFDEMPGFIR